VVVPTTFRETGHFAPTIDPFGSRHRISQPDRRAMWNALSECALLIEQRDHGAPDCPRKCVERANVVETTDERDGFLAVTVGFLDGTA
jgi:hypothetical protein